MLRFLFIGLLMASVPAAAAAEQQARAVSSGTLTGIVVVQSDTPKEVPGAIVTLSDISLDWSRITVTDQHGKFVFEDLLPGRFKVFATKPGYISARYGVKRLGDPADVVTLESGNHIDGIQMTMFPGAVIDGRVQGPDGTPLEGAAVSVLSVSSIPGTETAPGCTTFTDDRGHYRCYGLMPGHYAVVASFYRPALITNLAVPGTGQVASVIKALQNRPPLGLDLVLPDVRPAPVFYPSELSESQAGVVTLGIGEERSGVDIDLKLGRTAEVEGQVVVSRVVPSDIPIRVTLIASGDTLAAHLLPPSQTVIDAFGRFKFTNVTPGSYVVIAMQSYAATPTVSDADTWYGRSDVLVSGAESQIELSIVLQPGLTVQGHMSCDPRMPGQCPNMGNVTVRLVTKGGGDPLSSAIAGMVTYPFVSYMKVHGDGRFSVAGLPPEHYAIEVAGLPPLWVASTATLDGVDVALDSLDITAAGESHELSIVLAKKKQDRSAHER